MGQKQPVQVFILITEGTIEERLLSTLSAKHDLALAALDAESDVDQVKLEGGMEELRRRLEVLLGARPEAPRDESLRRETEWPPSAPPAQRLALTGGQLLSAAFQFLGELLPAPSASSALTDSHRLGGDAEAKPHRPCGTRRARASAAYLRVAGRNGSRQPDSRPRAPARADSARIVALTLFSYLES